MIQGTIVSTRGSIAAAANCSPPPYESPTIPTRGSFGTVVPRWVRLSRRTDVSAGARCVRPASRNADPVAPPR